MSTDIIQNGDLAGVSVVTSNGIETPAASGEELRRIDELQHELREGPCYAALQPTDVDAWGRQSRRHAHLHASPGPWT